MNPSFYHQEEDRFYEGSPVSCHILIYCNYRIFPLPNKKEKKKAPIKFVFPLEHVMDGFDNMHTKFFNLKTFDLKLLLYLFMFVLGITFQFIKSPNFLFSSRNPLICFLIGYTFLIQELLLAEYDSNGRLRQLVLLIYLQGRFSLDNFKCNTFLLDRKYS